MKCRLLLPMFAMSVCQSVRPKSVCLSLGSSRLYCAEQIKILFGGPRNIVLDGGPDPPTPRGGGFDAAFAKLLWPFVLFAFLLCYCNTEIRRVMHTVWESSNSDVANSWTTSATTWSASQHAHLYFSVGSFCCWRSADDRLQTVNTLTQRHFRVTGANRLTTVTDTWPAAVVIK